MNSFPRLKPGDFVLVNSTQFGQVVTVFPESPPPTGRWTQTSSSLRCTVSYIATNNFYDYRLTGGPLAVYAFDTVTVLPVTEDICKAGRKALTLHLAFCGVDTTGWVWREKEEPKEEDG